MNEGHASLLTLELLNDRATKASRKAITHDDLDPVRRMCVFTTHTPVPAGHDQFPMGLVAQVLGRREIYDMKEVFCCEGVLNMTFLAANLSHYINGVAKRHGEISRHMISRYVIDAITTVYTLAPGHRSHFGSCSTDTFPIGTRTISACEARSASRALIFGRRTPGAKSGLLGT